ncbi:MAG: hypothetical protein NTX38_16385 [Methylobacter sp.]|nr:hypothetical protein [Methylobacter sp.]
MTLTRFNVLLFLTRVIGGFCPELGTVLLVIAGVLAGTGVTVTSGLISWLEHAVKVINAQQINSCKLLFIGYMALIG